MYAQLSNMKYMHPFVLIKNMLQMTNPANDSSALVDIDFEPGEKLMAQVIGVNVYKKSGKSRHRKCLEMTLREARKVIFHSAAFLPSYCR